MLLKNITSSASPFFIISIEPEIRTTCFSVKCKITRKTHVTHQSIGYMYNHFIHRLLHANLLGIL